MKTGQKYKCTKGLTLMEYYIDIAVYTYGEIYPVYETKGGKPYIINDIGSEVFGLREGHFELISE